MTRFLLSLILLFSLNSISFGNCAGDDCATSDQKLSCAQDTQGDQSQSQETSSDHDHCAFHCNHSVSVSIPLNPFKMPVIAHSITANYFFAYQDPTLDSIERPPLSC